MEVKVKVNGCTVILDSMDCILEWKRKTESQINKLNYELNEKKEELDNIYKYLYENCKHEIVQDYVDQMDGYKLSIPIKYCTKCELTFTKNKIKKNN